MKLPEFLLRFALPLKRISDRFVAVVRELHSPGGSSNLFLHINISGPSAGTHTHTHTHRHTHTLTHTQLCECVCVSVCVFSIMCIRGPVMSPVIWIPQLSMEVCCLVAPHMGVSANLLRLCC